jgi:hypothetical protein
MMQVSDLPVSEVMQVPDLSESEVMQVSDLPESPAAYQNENRAMIVPARAANPEAAVVPSNMPAVLGAW